MRSLSAPVAILGGAQSDFARRVPGGATGLVSLVAETLDPALAACRLDTRALRGLALANRMAAFVGNFNAPCFLNQGHLGAFLGEANPLFVGVPTARYEAACASGSIALEAADAAIRAGDIDVAVVVGVEIMRTVSPGLANDYLGLAAPHDEVEGVPFAFPRIFGRLSELILEREEKTPGAESRLRLALDAISANNYANARQNPLAHMRAFPGGAEGNTRLQALDQRFGEALGGRTLYRDCSQISDGAAVLILASPEYAREHAAHRDGIGDLAVITGRGRRTAPPRVAAREEDFRTTPPGQHPLPWTARAISEALLRSGHGAAELDVIETHDCFTSSEYLALSAFGLCLPGEESSFIEGGHLSLANGQTAAGRRGQGATHRNVVVNATGGLIGAGHPVGATGVRMAFDLFRQLTGRAGALQVEDARVGAMLNIGGTFATNACFVVENARGHL